MSCLHQKRVMQPQYSCTDFTGIDPWPVPVTVGGPSRWFRMAPFWNQWPTVLATNRLRRAILGSPNS